METFTLYFVFVKERKKAPLKSKGHCYFPFFSFHNVIEKKKTKCRCKCPLKLSNVILFDKCVVVAHQNQESVTHGSMFANGIHRHTIFTDINQHNAENCNTLIILYCLSSFSYISFINYMQLAVLTSCIMLPPAARQHDVTHDYYVTHLPDWRQKYLFADLTQGAY